jgi:putative ubiquitin-RnfH superfamily antitoxin RatB of RatAB toxin-antitoxin module
MAQTPPIVEVEVIYALPDEQQLLTVRVPAVATVRQVIAQSGVIERYPELKLAQLNAGVFGKVVDLDAHLHAGDRIEIYRPLTVDPKDARRRRSKLRGK